MPIHIRGRVEDDLGRAIPGAEVVGSGWRSHRGGFYPNWAAVSDEDGCFGADSTTSELLFEFRVGGMASASARGYGECELGESAAYLGDLRAGIDPESITIVLERMAWVEGAVKDAVGDPLPGFPLQIRQWCAGPDIPSITSACRADPRGCYSFRGINPRECTYIELWPDFPGGESSVVRLDGPFSPEVIGRADVIVPEVYPGRYRKTGPWVLSAVVVDDFGHPVQGARHAGGYFCSAYDWPECSGSDGVFELLTDRELPEPGTGLWIGDLWARGYLNCSLKLSAEEVATLCRTGRLEGIRLTMPRVALVEGRVLDETGTPLQGVEVIVSRDAASRRLNGGPGTSCLTDENGSFAFDGLDANETLYLLATLEGRTPTRISLAGRLDRGGTANVGIVLPPLREVPAKCARFPGHGIDLRHPA